MWIAIVSAGTMSVNNKHIVVWQTVCFHIQCVILFVYDRITNRIYPYTVCYTVCIRPYNKRYMSIYRLLYRLYTAVQQTVYETVYRLYTVHVPFIYRLYTVYVLEQTHRIRKTLILLCKINVVRIRCVFRCHKRYINGIQTVYKRYINGI